MATIRFYTTAGAKLAEQEIPDAAMPRLQVVFGGATAAQTAAAFLTWVTSTARAHVRHIILEGKWATDYQAVNTAQQQEGAQLETDWP